MVELTLHVYELPGLFVVGRIEFLVGLLLRYIRHFGSGNDDASAYCSLEVVFLSVH